MKVLTFYNKRFLITKVSSYVKLLDYKLETIDTSDLRQLVNLNIRKTVSRIFYNNIVYTR